MKIRVTQRCISLLIALIFASANVGAADWLYTVRPGDTLWNISQRYLIDTSYWAQVKAHNVIKNPRHLQPGSVLKIPLTWLKEQPKSVIVLYVRGDAQVKVSDQAWQVLQVKMSLGINSTVQTAKGAAVTLEFADGTILWMQASTTLRLNRVSVFGKTGMVDIHMNLKNGRIDAQVPPLRTPSSRFEITTPAAVAAVRGTQFRVNFNPLEEKMYSEVTQGQIAVEAHGVERSVLAGFGVVTEQGKPPALPVRLLPAPVLAALASRVSQPPVFFEWPPVPNAKAYLAQLSQDETFVEITRESMLTRPQINWGALSLGTYYMRVRAVNQQGLQGFEGQHRFIQLMQLTPPSLENPINGKRLTIPNLTFHWIAGQNNPYFYFQLSTTQQFDRIVFDSVVKTQYLVLPMSLPPGQYYWRVASRNDPEYEKNEVFSEIFSFSIVTN